MVCKVFILGRTGSGKSTAARLLAEVAQQSGWSVEAFNDYPFLREMFMTNPGKRFRATEHDGFEVLDLSVYDEAIAGLLQSVQNYRPATDKTLLTIEFTSNNYARALESFEDEFVRDASFIFIAADLKTCLKRIDKRTLYPITRDDYYVIETVLLQHYPSPYMPPNVHGEKVTFMNNMDSLEELETKVKEMVSMLSGQENKSHVLALQRKTIYSPYYEYSSSSTHQWDSMPRVCAVG